MIKLSCMRMKRDWLFQRSLAPLSPLPVSLLRKLAVATHRNNRDMRWITGMVAAAAACATGSSGTPFECTIHRDLCGFDEAVIDAPPAPPLAEDCCVSTVPSPPNMNNCGGSVASLLCVHCAITTQHDQSTSNLSPVVHARSGSKRAARPSARSLCPHIFSTESRSTALSFSQIDMSPACSLTQQNAAQVQTSGVAVCWEKSRLCAGWHGCNVSAVVHTGSSGHPQAGWVCSGCCHRCQCHGESIVVREFVKSHHPRDL